MPGPFDLGETRKLDFQISKFSEQFMNCKLLFRLRAVNMENDGCKVTKENTIVGIWVSAIILSPIFLIAMVLIISLASQNIGLMLVFIVLGLIGALFLTWQCIGCFAESFGGDCGRHKGGCMDRLAWESSKTGLSPRDVR